MPNPKVIRVRGARTHNLKNVSVEIPLNAVTVVTGVSGSGKSSLAFDTLYAEAQRRYVESLSIRARQAMDLLPRADVEAIENLPAAVAIEQKTLVRNPRSTVGTITELSDALRLLFARTGQPFCPEHGEPLSAQIVAEMVERTLERSVEARILITAPLAQSDEPTVRRLAPWSAKGYTRFVAEGVAHEMEEAADLPEQVASLELVVDRLRVREEQRERLAESFESAAKIGNGRVLVREMDSSALYAFRRTTPVPYATTAPRFWSRNFSRRTILRGAVPSAAARERSRPLRLKPLWKTRESRSKRGRFGDGIPLRRCGGLRSRRPAGDSASIRLGRGNC